MEKRYWLTPDGELISVNCHITFAFAYAKENDIEWNPREGYIYLILHKLGWVRITIYEETNTVKIVGDCIGEDMKNTMDPPMNALQMSVAKELCSKYGKTIKEAVNF